jgi:hypothetical protein
VTTRPGAVELWQRDPDRSDTARAGLRMLAGEWMTSDAADMTRSSFSQTVLALRKAGYTVESQSAGSHGLKAYRVKPKRATAARSNGHVPREVDGVTYPRLGATLTVRALVLGDDGALVVQLTDAAGGAWSATVTGHVGA